MTDADRILMTDVLKGVSRAFYLTLRVLPGGLRESIGLAYLLARAADTIADTRILPPGTRMRHLLAFRAAVESKSEGAVPPGELQDLIEPQVDPRERRLLETLPHALAMLEELPADDRRRVRAIVVQLTQGMEYDLVQFPAEDTGPIAALPSFAELDHYTYLVAGCVGESSG
jgi:farnesyl-diphosphate farnesyltransferase